MTLTFGELFFCQVILHREPCGAAELDWKQNELLINWGITFAFHSVQNSVQFSGLSSGTVECEISMNKVGNFTRYNRIIFCKVYFWEFRSSWMVHMSEIHQFRDFPEVLPWWWLPLHLSTVWKVRGKFSRRKLICALPKSQWEVRGYAILN